MPATYSLIASNTLGASAASVTFSAIPATYTDLVLRFSSRDNRAVDNQNPFSLVINSDTGSNYSQTQVYGFQGPTTYSDRYSNDTKFTTWTSNTANNTANTFTNGELYFANYTSTGNRQFSLSSVMENNVGTGGVFLPIVTALLYRGSGAISSFSLTPQNSASFVSGSSFFLYGIKNS